MFGLTLLFLHHFDLFVNVFLIVETENRLKRYHLSSHNFSNKFRGRNSEWTKRKKENFFSRYFNSFPFYARWFGLRIRCGAETTWVRDLFLNQFFETDHTCKGLNQGRARNQEKATTLSTLSRRLSSPVIFNHNLLGRFFSSLKNGKRSVSQIHYIQYCQTTRAQNWTKIWRKLIPQI